MRETFNPAGWKRPKGYSNAVSAQGRLVFIAGQIGWTSEEAFETDDFIGQTRQALQNVKDALAAAGAVPEHITRLTWYVVDKHEYLSRLTEVGAIYREILGRVYPAMTMVQVAGLVEDRARIEIEATAVVPVPKD